MSFDPFIPSSSVARRNGAMFVDMRARLEDLQRQIATGRKTESLADLGVDRRISLDVRARLSTLEGWTKGIEQGDLRIRFMMQSVEGFSKLTLDGKADARTGGFVMASNGDVAGQILARERLQQSIDMLNAEVNGRYLFSGRTHDVKPVETFDRIMNGDGMGRDGVRTLIDQRQQADAGVGNLGRLTTALAGTTVSVAREAANPPYGFVLQGATSSTPAITASTLPGPPLGLSFAVTANPQAGDRITLTLGLPDGTSQTLSLEARLPTVGGPAATGFQIGATPAATAANLEASVQAALQKETATSLNAASALVAARSFFNGFNADGTFSGAAMRVPGPAPFTTQTLAPVAVTATDTVQWYRGDADPAIASRNTATLQVDQNQIVAAGARANEATFREGLAVFAAYSALSFTAADPNSRDRYEAMGDRVRTGLSFTNTQKPQDIGVEISAAQFSMKAATERHRLTGNLLENARAGVEDASQEEVAAALLSMQTRMQATYQTTAILSRLSLTSYLG